MKPDPLPPEVRGADTIACRIAVERTNEHFFAHQVYYNNPAFEPGDSVITHGEEIHVQNGSKFLVKRRASVKKANWFQRQWTKFISILEITELYEVSFTGRRKL